MADRTAWTLYLDGGRPVELRRLEPFAAAVAGHHPSADVRPGTTQHTLTGRSRPIVRTRADERELDAIIRWADELGRSFGWTSETVRYGGRLDDLEPEADPLAGVEL